MVKIRKTASIEKGIEEVVKILSEEEIQPTLHNVQETTETLNRNITKIDELISIISEFSKQAVDRMSFYRDRLYIPFNDLISFYAAFKAGFEKFTSKNS